MTPGWLRPPEPPAEWVALVIQDCIGARPRR